MSSDTDDFHMDERDKKLVTAIFAGTKKIVKDAVDPIIKALSIKR